MDITIIIPIITLIITLITIITTHIIIITQCIITMGSSREEQFYSLGGAVLFYTDICTKIPIL
jgi:hypothetical protein